MGERTEYTPGTFSWTDLTTPDQEGAKSFYTALFGWDLVEHPVGENSVYMMASIDGKEVAAISPQPQQQRDAGVPPMWNSYVTVQSADEAAARAGELGGTVHAPPFDVMDVGRMAVIADPQGAFFEVWEPRQHVGAGLVNAHGALSWNELATTDVEAAQSFYGSLFGWTFDPFDSGEMPYFVIKRADGGGNGGLTVLPDPGIPPHWLVYFGSDDAEADQARAEELGAGLIAGPFSIGPGKIVVLRDPQGAVFALYGGEFEG